MHGQKALVPKHLLAEVLRPRAVHALHRSPCDCGALFVGVGAREALFTLSGSLAAPCVMYSYLGVYGRFTSYSALVCIHEPSSALNVMSFEGDDVAAAAQSWTSFCADLPFNAAVQVAGFGF